MAGIVVSVEIPAPLFGILQRLAQATHQSVDAVVASSLTHALPPLDDLADAEAAELAAMSTLDDAALWRVARETLTPTEQADMHRLLDLQGAQPLDATDEERLADLVNLYDHVTLRRAHALLLLARRGYRVPVEDGE